MLAVMIGPRTAQQSIYYLEVDTSLSLLFLLVTVFPCSEDIENIRDLKSKMSVPDAPPVNISPDVLELNTIIGARYIGGASFIKLKTPAEGFSKQGTVLKKIRSDYEKQGEKVYMMGLEQQAIFQSGVTNYCNFGGHGSGKNSLPTSHRMSTTSQERRFYSKQISEGRRREWLKMKRPRT